MMCVAMNGSVPFCKVGRNDNIIIQYAIYIYIKERKKWSVAFASSVSLFRSCRMMM